MRLRPLTEAECYARCYGGIRSEQVSVLRLTTERTERVAKTRFRELTEDRRAARRRAA